MSTSLKFAPVPAFEMLQTLCQLDAAKREFESMSSEEKETFTRIMDRCRIRRDGQLDSSPTSSVVNQNLPRVLVIENISITERISNCLRYIGYTVQSIDNASFGIVIPKLILEW